MRDTIPAPPPRFDVDDDSDPEGPPVSTLVLPEDQRAMLASLDAQVQAHVPMVMLGTVGPGGCQHAATQSELDALERGLLRGLQ